MTSASSASKPVASAFPARSGEEWEAWFRRLSAELDTMEADTDSIVTDDRAVIGNDVGYSVLELTQTLAIGDRAATFDCIATIVWKLTPLGWRRARWHGSPIRADVPDGFGPAAR